MNTASLDLCKELDCDRSVGNHGARGYCPKHYKRLMRQGNPSIAYPNKTKHGMNKTKEWSAWAAMRQRCRDENHPVYYLYGGRGIKFHDSWLDFDQFYKDMGPAPSPKHSIERVDNDGDYTPWNCIWADQKTQSNNTRRNKSITYKGKRQTIAQWADELNIKYDTLYARISRGWSIERALSCTLHR